MALSDYRFEVQKVKDDDPLEEKKAICFSPQGQEMGYVQFAGLEYDYCVRIQYLYVKPEFRGQGTGSALLNYLKDTYREAPIYTYISPVEKGVKLNYLMDFFAYNDFYIKPMSGFDAEGYYNFED